MIIEGWFCCPVCKKKLFKLNEGATAAGIQYKCKRCKTIIDVEIEPKSQ